VRSTETDFFMAECFDRANNTCPLTPDCQLKWVLNRATQAYLAVLDGVTLASLLPQPGQDATVIHFHPPLK
jgi:Rrf2 family nitric oxide-sensitive transcriptional repressor